jgi:branched-chain amino acid transport system ATP-binding protein
VRASQLAPAERECHRRMSDPGALLSARGLSKSYGPFKAVDSVNLDIHEHDIHVFIGPNGAGKSTVLNLLGGQILPSAGEIFFAGRPLGTTTPSRRARAGIGRSFQLTSIVPGFTCVENVVLAVQALAHELLALVELQGVAEVPAEILSHGQQRQLEIAVALGGKPRLLLLDEPSSGMSAHERAGLAEVLQRVVNTATVVMAEHDVHVVRTVATRVTAFAEGKTIAEGSADEVFDSDTVKRVFLRGRRDA